MANMDIFIAAALLAVGLPCAMLSEKLRAHMIGPIWVGIAVFLGTLGGEIGAVAPTVVSTILGLVVLVIFTKRGTLEIITWIASVLVTFGYANDHQTRAQMADGAQDIQPNDVGDTVADGHYNLRGVICRQDIAASATRTGGKPKRTSTFTVVALVGDGWKPPQPVVGWLDADTLPSSQSRRKSVCLGPNLELLRLPEGDLSTQAASNAAKLHGLPADPSPIIFRTAPSQSEQEWQGWLGRSVALLLLLLWATEAITASVWSRRRR